MQSWNCCKALLSYFIVNKPKNPSDIFLYAWDGTTFVAKAALGLTDREVTAHGLFEPTKHAGTYLHKQVSEVSCPETQCK